MKKFAILLTIAILGSAAYAAGTNMIQDEPSPDSRPARNVEKRKADPFDAGHVDDGLEPSPRGETTQYDDSFGAPAYRNEGRGMGGGPGMGMGPASGMGGPGLGEAGAMGVPGMGMGGPGMGGRGMSGPEGRYMRPRSVTRTIVEQRMEPLSKEEIAEMRKLAEATRLLHESKDDEARKKAADSIREHLNAQFDRDLKRREKELADIEARLKTLREQVEKRKAARDRIVGLRLDTIVNEADDLGFPADSVGSANNFPSRNRSAAGGEWLDVPAGQTLPGGYRLPGFDPEPDLERGDFLPPGEPFLDKPEPAEVPEEASDELRADLQPR